MSGRDREGDERGGRITSKGFTTSKRKDQPRERERERAKERALKALNLLNHIDGGGGLLSESKQDVELFQHAIGLVGYGPSHSIWVDLAKLIPTLFKTMSSKPCMHHHLHQDCPFENIKKKKREKKRRKNGSKQKMPW